MFSFFISRPIFAAVISIIITVAGLVASQVLPIAQYPEIAPPTVTITATYPGASAETLSKTVAAPIEEQLSGVDGLLYFSSTSASNGVLTITVTFEVGTDINNATIQVNNRVQIALPRLPDEARRTGVVVQKRSTDILLAVAISSTDTRYDTLYLSNFITVNVLDVLRRNSALPLPTWPMQSACRITSMLRARSARSRRRRTSPWCTRSPPPGASSIRRSSATSFCAPTVPAGCCASRTSHG